MHYTYSLAQRLYLWGKFRFETISLHLANPQCLSVSLSSLLPIRDHISHQMQSLDMKMYVKTLYIHLNL